MRVPLQAIEGTVDVHEFMAIMARKMKESNSEDEIHETFRSLDKVSSGRQFFVSEAPFFPSIDSRYIPSRDTIPYFMICSLHRSLHRSLT